MRVFEICKYIGLTYEQYLDQPDWFINLAQLRMNMEGQIAQMNQKQWQRKQNLQR